MKVYIFMVLGTIAAANIALWSYVAYGFYLGCII